MLDKLSLTPPKNNKLKKWHLDGLVNTTFLIRSHIKEKTYKLNLEAETKEVKINKIKLENAHLLVYSENKNLVINPLTADIWGGKILLKLQKKEGLFTINLIGDEINLTQAKQELSLKKKDLAGKLGIEFFLEKFNLENLHTAEGKGKAIIKEGNIWEISLLKGLGEFLFIPEFNRIVFDEGYADFLIKDGYLIIDELELNSRLLTLQGQGRISLEQEVEFLLFPNLNPTLINSSQSLKKIFTNVLGKGALAVEVKGKGNKLNYRIKPMLLSPLQRFRDILQDIIK